MTAGELFALGLRRAAERESQGRPLPADLTTEVLNMVTADRDKLRREVERLIMENHELRQRLIAATRR